MQLGGSQSQFAVPKPGKGVVGLLIALTSCYVLQLVLLRAGQSWVQELYLRPSGVFDHGRVWQPLTYIWLHLPKSPSHLIYNGIFLWVFGSTLEKWWGTKRFLIAYLIFALGGGALTLLVGGLSTTSALAPIMGGFWSKPHVGASGAVMGVTVAWGLVFADKEINILLLGRMKGRTLLLILVAVELLVALSFDPISSTSHFGGMFAALVLVKGLWRPDRWKEMGRKAQLKRKKRKIESELQVIQGGKDDDPKMWN